MNKKINSFIKLLIKKQLTLAFSESITCGMAANKLATIKGVSKVLLASVVCYSPESKMELMKVKKKIID